MVEVIENDSITMAARLWGGILDLTYDATENDETCIKRVIAGLYRCPTEADRIFVHVQWHDRNDDPTFPKRCVIHVHLVLKAETDPIGILALHGAICKGHEELDMDPIRLSMSRVIDLQ